MKMSRLLAPTLREVPAEAEVISHQLMLRAGMIRKLAAGIYDYLPLGYRVIRKVENIVREEMDRAGAQEVFLPSLVPAELWQKSGRWEKYGKELLRIKDRADREFCYGPTHEEVITDLVSNSVKSYKELPINLYQIQTKFRDEIRPRFGLMRGREFQMKDAYSFHATTESLDAEYQNMYRTYCRIFERCGLKYKVVEADSGNIGGSVSQEFMVLADTGESELLYCDQCSYAANSEAACSQLSLVSGDRHLEATDSLPELVATPNTGKIEEVEAFLKISAVNFIKTLVYLADDVLWLVLTRGDRSINEIKLKNAISAEWVLLADDVAVEKLTGAKVGFAGPVGMHGKVKIVADHSIKTIQNGITGANKTDYHLKNVKLGRDFLVNVWGDLDQTRVGDLCPKCGKGELQMTRGIEVGHIFKLGTKYSEKMSALYLDEHNSQKPYIMGCYGIGIGRTAAAAIEQNHDKDGIAWPLPLAPYSVALVLMNTTDAEHRKAAESLYIQLQESGIEVLFDDRDERPGVKMKDMDLIGIPLKVIIGKAWADGKLEVKKRGEREANYFGIDEALVMIKQMFNYELRITN